MQKMRLALLMLMVLFLAACGADAEGTEPTEFRVACFGCKQEFVSGQLNTDFGLCQDCMMKVGAAYCQNCAAPCYTRDMVHGLCQTCCAGTEETVAVQDTSAVESEPASYPQSEKTGRCVDCGALITDPASFDPYHCAGCGGSEYFFCDRCGKRTPSIESISRMCVDCYWSSGSTGGHCVICGGSLDAYVGSGIVCTVCYNQYGDNIHNAMLQPEPMKCSICKELTTSGAYLRNGEFACSECVNAPNPEHMGRCDTCGQLYKDGEGFESLCYDCQDKYGPKCSVCGTDCTYRGTVDGMCDDCWDAAQGAPEYVGTCDTCGQPYKDGEGFESLCYSCQDKYGPKCSVCGADLTYQGGEDGMCYACYEASRMCIVCGSASGDYDGYCYYCHPDFGYTCSGCGKEQPEHRPASGLCYECREKNGS